jgi:hypothetical protein
VSVPCATAALTACAIVFAEAFAAAVASFKFLSALFTSPLIFDCISCADSDPIASSVIKP